MTGIGPRAQSLLVTIAVVKVRLTSGALKQPTCYARPLLTHPSRSITHYCTPIFSLPPPPPLAPLPSPGGPRNNSPFQVLSYSTGNTAVVNDSAASMSSSFFPPMPSTSQLFTFLNYRRHERMRNSTFYRHLCFRNDE